MEGSEFIAFIFFVFLPTADSKNKGSEKAKRLLIFPVSVQDSMNPDKKPDYYKFLMTN